MAQRSKKSSRKAKKASTSAVGFIAARAPAKGVFKKKASAIVKFKGRALAESALRLRIPAGDLFDLRKTTLPTVRATAKSRARVYSPPPALFMSAGLQQFVERSPALQKRVGELAQQVEFTVATQTRSGVPLQDTRGQVAEMKLDDLRPTPRGQETAARRLKTLGFEVLRRGRFGITARGPAKLVEELIGEPLAVTRLPPNVPLRSMQAFGGDNVSIPAAEELFLVPTNSLSVPPVEKEAGDHVVFAPPATNFQVRATAPSVAYHTLDGAKVRSLLKADAVASEAKGVNLAIIDNGFAVSHPYYASYRAHIRALASPGGPAADQDIEGHGTAILWNVFAVAPKAAVLGVRYANRPYQDALEIAVDNGADILSCSWGWPYEQSFPILEATIRSIVEEDGKIVLFATGNGQQAWPASMPQVIAVGGVYADTGDSLHASNFASGYVSSLYPGRRVPDVSGLCGQGPKGIYLPLPCPAGSPMDVQLSGPNYPSQDTTGPKDGWVYASGTSSATPQVAAVLALLMEKTKLKGTALNNDLARQLLTESATPVTQGRNAMGFPAVGHPNVACGYGLVDAERLFALAAQRGYI